LREVKAQRETLKGFFDTDGARRGRGV